jgi:DNA-binding transcriptional LysR family regulator
MARRLDSGSLTQFVAVARSLSFRQAADALHVSQPPLSRAIKNLEMRLGVRLFTRGSRGVELTAAGERLLPQARRILGLLDKAARSLSPDQDQDSLRVGLTNAVDPARFDGLVHRLRASFKRVDVVSAASPRLATLVRKGRLDAAFIALPTDTGALDITELDAQPLVVAMRSTHRLSRRRVLELSDLCNEPLYWFERSRQPAFFDHCQRVFALHNFEPKTIKEPLDHHVLLAGVADGRALALLPSSFIAIKRAGVSYRRLREGAELAVGIGLAMPGDRPELKQLLLRLATSRR